MHVEPYSEVRDPIEALLRLSGRPGRMALDADGRGTLGRYSFVASDPPELRARQFGEEPLDALPPPTPPDEGPWASIVPRWVGYLGYDAGVGGGSGVPARHLRSLAAPIACWARYDAVYVHDHATGQAQLVGDDARATAALRTRLSASVAHRPRAHVGEIASEPPAAHLAAVRAALEAMSAGEIYQVNLARRWTASLSGDPLALYLAMREASPVPLGFYFEPGGQVVLGRSMERFLRWEGPGGTLESRPIKGTIATSAGTSDSSACDLRGDPKEHAEHAMIVDLVRNDLGRVAEVGSVSLPELFAVEPYARLSHLVSTVCCRTRGEVGLREVLEATFPPGSVTGAPKIRAMQLIEALERGARGLYCGALGYLDRAGGASLAVAIRTATVVDGEVAYFAGGGLVEASDPERELAETELKARVFFDACAALESSR